MNDNRELIVSIVGGVVFATVWILLELLVADDPSLLNGVIVGVAGGAAFFLGRRILRRVTDGT